MTHHEITLVDCQGSRIKSEKPYRSKSVCCIFSTVIGATLLGGPGGAASVSYAPVSGSDNGVLNGTLSLRSIGPLHMSDGVAVLKDNQVFVISDESDTEAEAELAGGLVDPHIVGKGNSQTICGLAVFTRGYSLPALDYKVEDAVTCTDGFGYRGRIVNVTGTQLLLKTTRDGAKSIPLSNITSINSPRVFGFSIPIEPADSISGTPDGSSAGPHPAASGARSNITFTPTYTFDPDAPPQLKTSIKAPEQQLSDSSIGKRVMYGAAWAAGICACFAIPIIIGAVTPKLLQQTKEAVKTNQDIRNRGGIDKVVELGVNKKLRDNGLVK